MENEATYAAFTGARRIAAGPLRAVLPVLKRRFDEARSETVLVFELETGLLVHFDLRGSLEEVLERATRGDRRGPGRPRLGVTSREVSLLPRHWEWLDEQPSGISAALRRLVDSARKDHAGAERARRIRAALAQFLAAVGEDRPGYEEVCRALYRGDTARLETLVQRWPRDLREHAVQQARLAARAEEAPIDAPAGERIVRELYRLVWSQGEYGAIARLVAPRYVIHSDPGDPCEGQTLDHGTYAGRVRYSRTAFPDLTFTAHELVAAGDRVAVRWSAEGTHAGDLPELPATGKHVGFSGQTIYELSEGRVAGHWQVVDRLGFVQQVRAGARVATPPAD